MTSLVACLMSLPSVSALADISYKSQKVFEFYRQTDRQTHMYMYIFNESFTLDISQIRLTRRILNFTDIQTDRQTDRQTDI